VGLGEGLTVRGRKEGRGGWRNFHKEDPDDLYIWGNRTGLMK